MYRVGSAINANLKDTTKLPVQADILQQVKKNRWVSEEYEHLWRRDGGGSAALTSLNVLSKLEPDVTSNLVNWPFPTPG